jgi:hypothetical protein
MMAEPPRQATAPGALARSGPLELARALTRKTTRTQRRERRKGKDANEIPWDTFLQKQSPSYGSRPGAASRPDTNRARMETYYARPTRRQSVSHRCRQELQTIIAFRSAATRPSPNLPGPELRRILASDCPRMIEGNTHDVCAIHFPGLGSG